MKAEAAAKIHKRFLSIALGLVAAALLLAVLGAVAWYRASGPSASRETSSFYEGTRLNDAAPGFRLTDQNGTAVSLSDFRDRVVVLTLLDPGCTDICPIYAQHYRLAYQALGKDAARVAFLALNANDETTAVEDVAAATRKWGADEIPTWHFLTGSPEALHAAWKAYGLLGSGPPKKDRPNEKEHSPAIFVIDQTGKLRWYFSLNFKGAPAPSALIVKHVTALLTETHRR